MSVTCCYHISTHYSERQTLVVFLLCVHCGWSSLLRKLLSTMMRLSWLETVFWCRGFILRYNCDHKILFLLESYLLVCILNHLVGNSIFNMKVLQQLLVETYCENTTLFKLTSSKCEFQWNCIFKMRFHVELAITHLAVVVDVGSKVEIESWSCNFSFDRVPREVM